MEKDEVKGKKIQLWKLILIIFFSICIGCTLIYYVISYNITKKECNNKNNEQYFDSNNNVINKKTLAEAFEEYYQENLTNGDIQNNEESLFSAKSYEMKYATLTIPDEEDIDDYIKDSNIKHSGMEDYLSSSKEYKSFDLYYDCCYYYYYGGNKGKLIINDTEVITDKEIRDVYLESENGYGHAYNKVIAYLFENCTYEYTEKLYVLYEDGTVGVITTDDIKAGNYEIKKLNEYNDISYIITITSGIINTDAGSDSLIGVKTDGTIVSIDDGVLVGTENETNTENSQKDATDIDSNLNETTDFDNDISDESNIDKEFVVEEYDEN